MRSRKSTLGDTLGEIFEQLRQQIASAPTKGTIVSVKGHANLGKRTIITAQTPPRVATQRLAASLPKLRKSGHREINQAAVAVKKKNLDFNVYRGEVRNPKLPVGKSKALSELSADMTRLSIRAAKSEASIVPPAGPVAVGKRDLAILGLDFGTAFTKAVVLFDDRHYVVNWSGLVKASDPHLLPSSFSEHEDGSVVLGIESAPRWSHHDGIKMRLLALGSAADDDAQCDAVLFIAAVARYVADWFPNICRDADSPRWRLHLGLPAEPWADPLLTALFSTLASAGLGLAREPGPLSRQGARQTLRAARDTQDEMVLVLPEFACQLYSYLDSAQRQSDIHALMDVGAGTLDLAFFIVHSHDNEDKLPILSASINPLGTHYLIGALAGKVGEHLERRDDDAAAHDEKVASWTGEINCNVSPRRQAYLHELGCRLNTVRNQAREKYPTSRTWHENAPVDLFLCGGGSRLQVIRDYVDSWRAGVRKTCLMTFRVVPLPKPQNLEGDLEADQYDRVSVAYGLSQLPGNVGNVIRRDDLEPLDSPVRPEIEDRDASR